MRHVNVFSFLAKYLPKVDPRVMTHQLNIDPLTRPIKHKKGVFVPNRQEVIVAKVDKLLITRFIMKENYPTWLANVVLVLKPKGK